MGPSQLKGKNFKKKKKSWGGGDDVISRLPGCKPDRKKRGGINKHFSLSLSLSLSLA
jgi:hypothetical protein